LRDGDRTLVQGSALSKRSETGTEKLLKHKRAEGMAKVIEHMASKWEVLNLNLSATKKRYLKYKN
jgi:hypothetical protein